MKAHVENYSFFYQEVTKIAESRIKELVQHGINAEAEDHVFPEAGLYFRGCAQTVYLAWRDITDGWRTEGDIKRLESFIDLPPWIEVGGSE